MPVSYADLKEKLMECSKPGVVRDEELLAYLTGEQVRPVVIRHLASCTACAARLKRYKYIDLTLTSKLSRWDCPSSLILGEYEQGLLAPEHERMIGKHIRLCQPCATELAELQQFMAYDLIPAYSPSPASLVSQTPPVTSLIEPALQWLHGQADAGVRWIVAVLVTPQPRLVFQREIAPTSTWPRRYVAEDLTISLQLESERPGSTGSGLQLIGFVNREGAPLQILQGTPVVLSQAGRVLETQEIDDLGNFVLSSIPQADYRLELKFPERTVVIEDLGT